MQVSLKLKYGDKIMKEQKEQNEQENKNQIK
jgi:hypothetical protein